MKSSRNKTLELSEEDRKKYVPQTVATLNSVTQASIDYLESLPSSTFDLVIADPPYNLDKLYGESKFKSMDLRLYLEWCENWIIEIKRLLKTTGTFYLCNDWRASALQLLLEKHFKVRNRITWEREKGRGSKDNWKNNSEDIWYCTKSDIFTFNVDAVKLKRRVLAPYKDENGDAKDWNEDKTRLTYPSNLWTDISVPFWSMSENTPHPTQKPEKLIAKLVLASSNKGDLVLDPFGGSGTTAVVCKKLNRNYMILEPELEYCQYALKRLDLANDRIQGYDGHIFIDRSLL